MTQKEKELVLKDLCTRLPYGIAIYRITNNSTHRIQYSDITENIDQFSHFLEYSGIENIKPYLSPMTSMTEEELKDLLVYSGMTEHEIELCKYDGGAELEFWLTEVPCKCINKVIDWLNSHHFDYRGLIEKGLALEAPEDMYNK